ncbi:translation initiation factor IF-2-like [Schistocerca serialis cubense]|uniref:translation initiation factor IF-2-like n=1 Tax=Schistocerca serialis cubense TaxID=2023355 RepID=UPI00214E2222|nr:translation initiation factor IF-2-like [Schistocerca serialis cubense]
MEDINIVANVAAVVAASEHALAAASNAPTPAAAPPGYRPLTAVELYVVINRMAKAATASEREAAEKAYRRFMQYDLPAALPGAASEEAKVPPGAPPGVSTQEDTALPEAAPKGAAPPGLAAQTANVLLAPQTVQANQEAAVLPAAPQPIEVIPEANLEQLIQEGEAMEHSLPSRKRPADAIDDDESPACASSVDRIQQKKKPHAPEGATDDRDDNEAAHEDAEGFVVPKRRHTARAKKLEPVQPIGTHNSFSEPPEEETMEAEQQAPQAKKLPAPPPIVLLWKDTFRSLLEKFKERKSPLRKTSSKTRQPQRAVRPASPGEAQPTEPAQDAPERTKAATCSGNGAGGPAQVQCTEARGEHNGPAASPGPSREQSRDAGTTPAPAAAVQRAAAGTPRHENAAAGGQQCADAADAEPATPHDDDGFQKPKRTAGRSPVLHTASPVGTKSSGS